MTHTVIGIFNTAAEAQTAAQKLSASQFKLEDVDVANNRYSADGNNKGGADRDPSDYQNTSGTMTEGAADAAGRTGDSISNFFSNLFGDDYDDRDRANRYSHVARQSGSIVTVHCHSDENARTAARILDEAGAINVDDKAAEMGYQGNNYAAGQQNQQSTNTNANRPMADNDQVSAKVIEENLEVGKRVEQTGGARLRSRIVERPVEASVRLREEHVTVDRHPVDRPATDADFNAFKEGTVEVTESAERAVVAKEARVVEEVTLGKEVSEREETIHDTVRKTEVDVERLGTDEANRKKNS